MVSLATKHNDPDASLGWSERIGFGSAQFGMNMINGIIGSFLTIYLTNVAFLDAAIISTLIAVSKIFDGFSDIIIGRMVDNTKSKLGKGRSWLLRMCLPFALTTLLLFFVPQNFPNMLKYVYVFIMYNAVSTVCFTSMAVPYYSMISLITSNPYERGLLGNVQQIFQTLGNIVVNALFVRCLTIFSSSAETIYTQRGFTITMIIVCVIMVATALLCVVSTKERVTGEKQEKTQTQKSENKASLGATLKALLTNKYWLIMIFANFVVFFVIIFMGVGATYYCQYVFYDMDNFSWMSNSISIPQFLIMFATPFLMKKFSKRMVYTAGMGCTVVGCIGFGLLGLNVPVMIAFNALKGIGMGMCGAVALGIVADTITYGNLRSNVDTVGMGNAGVSAAQKIGMGFGTAAFGWVLDGSGFDATLDMQGIAQPQSVSTAITWVYNWLPLILCAIVFILMLLFFNLDRDLARIRKEKGL